MIPAITLILMILIICVSSLFGIYMYLCFNSGNKMFEDHRYNERICKLEKEIQKLKEAK